MSVYSVVAEKASCPVAGCGCTGRARRYPSDMTDSQWEVLPSQPRWGGDRPAPPPKPDQQAA